MMLRQAAVGVDRHQTCRPIEWRAISIGNYIRQTRLKKAGGGQIGEG
jgi:hypothetical protein